MSWSVPHSPSGLSRGENGSGGSENAAGPVSSSLGGPGRGEDPCLVCKRKGLSSRESPTSLFYCVIQCTLELITVSDWRKAFCFVLTWTDNSAEGYCLTVP